MSEAFLSITITKKAFGWSKWGGANKGIFTLLPQEEWYCQSCGSEQTRDLPSYMIPMDISNRDFVKVCSGCKHIATLKKIKTFFELKTPKHKAI